MLAGINGKAEHQDAFYPPPNKTHYSTNTKRTRKSSKHSLRQAARVHQRETEAASAVKGFGSDHDRWGVTDMVPIELEDHLTDLQAKVAFYSKQIPDLTTTVDKLR